MQLEFPLGSDPRFPRIRDRLLACYGAQRDPWRLDVNARFIEAILSGDTSDEISGPAFLRLWTSVPSPEVLATYNLVKLAALISDVRHAERKAIYLRKAIRTIMAEYGHFDLHVLERLPVEAAHSRLTRLPGVGPKTAAATLNFSDLRMRAMVVDRHGLRILKCIGILSSKADFKNAFYQVMPLLPPEWSADDLYELHWLLKKHGQEICRPIFPACNECALSDICAHA